MELIRRRNWRLLLAFVFLSLKRSSWTYREPMKMSRSTNYIPCKAFAAAGGEGSSAVVCGDRVPELTGVKGHWTALKGAAQGRRLVLLDAEGKWNGTLRPRGRSTVPQKLKPLVGG